MDAGPTPTGRCGTRWRCATTASARRRRSALLREHDVALVVADTAGKWPYLEEVTADFVYVRLHGAEELYASGYTDEALDGWAAKLAGVARRRPGLPTSTSTTT